MSLVINSNNAGSGAFELANSFLSPFPDPQNAIILYPESTSFVLDGLSCNLAKSLVFPNALVGNSAGGGYGTQRSFGFGSFPNNDSLANIHQIISGTESFEMKKEWSGQYIVSEPLLSDGVFGKKIFVSALLVNPIVVFYEIKNSDPSGNTISISGSGYNYKIYVNYGLIRNGAVIPAGKHEISSSDGVSVSGTYFQARHSGFITWIGEIETAGFTAQAGDRIAIRYSLEVSCNISYTATYSSGTFEIHQTGHIVNIFGLETTQITATSNTGNYNYYNNSPTVSGNVQSFTNYVVSSYPIQCVQISVD